MNQTRSARDPRFYILITKSTMQEDELNLGILILIIFAIPMVGITLLFGLFTLISN